MNKPYIPIATRKRLPIYLEFLLKYKKEHQGWLQSEDISKKIGIAPSTVRRDLNFIAPMGGSKGYGYNINILIKSIEAISGGKHAENIVLVGVGNLGKAMIGYSNWERQTGNIVAAIHSNEKEIGKKIGGINIYSYDYLDKIIEIHNVRTAILTVPKEVVQEVFEHLKQKGIKAFLNMTSGTIVNNSRDIYIKTINIDHAIQELIYKKNLSF